MKFSNLKTLLKCNTEVEVSSLNNNLFQNEVGSDSRHDLFLSSPFKRLKFILFQFYPYGSKNTDAFPDTIFPHFHIVMQ